MRCQTFSFPSVILVWFIYFYLLLLILIDRGVQFYCCPTSNLESASNPIFKTINSHHNYKSVFNHHHPLPPGPDETRLSSNSTNQTPTIMIWLNRTSIWSNWTFIAIFEFRISSKVIQIYFRQHHCDRIDDKKLRNQITKTTYIHTPSRATCLSIREIYAHPRAPHVA